MMDNLNESIKGTIFKLNVHMNPVDNFHLADVEWEAEVFAAGGIGKRIKVIKEDAVKVDEDNYIISVDSAVGGAGEYSLILTAYIPDADCPNGIRVERASCRTRVKIAI